MRVEPLFDAVVELLSERGALPGGAVVVGLVGADPAAFEPEELLPPEAFEIVVFRDLVQHHRDHRPPAQEPRQLLLPYVVRTEKGRADQEQAQVATIDGLLDRIVPVLADLDVAVVPEDEVVVRRGAGLLAQRLQKLLRQLIVGAGMRDEESDPAFPFHETPQASVRPCVERVHRQWAPSVPSPGSTPKHVERSFVVSYSSRIALVGSIYQVLEIELMTL